MATPNNNTPNNTNNNTNNNNTNKNNNQPIPPAQKAQTIVHMNTAHRTDLRHILLHYGAVPPIPPSYYSSTTATTTTTTITTTITTTKDGNAPKNGNAAGNDDDAKNPLMTDIDLTGITLQLPGREGGAVLHRVGFEPPLAGWGERRGRLVEMTRVARRALGVDDASAGAPADGEGGDGHGDGDGAVVVDEYMAPRVPYDLAIFVAVLGYYAVYGLVWKGCFTEGSVAVRVVEGVRFPGGVEWFVWLVEAIFVPVVALHLFETWLLERTKLQRFGVRRGSAVWWKWVVSVFIEGAMAFKRFDLVVEKLRAQGKKGR